jgi:phosphohistidine phosphatase
MKTLGLFRHAKSDWGDARARDFDRPLNKRGRKGALVMGRHIHDFGQKWNRIIASPAVRAAETIEVAAVGAGRENGAGGSGGRAKGFAVNWDRRIYLASSAVLIDLLREQDDALDAILMVGHNPGLEDLIFDLVPDDGSSPLRDLVEVKFPTASFAVLQLNVANWAAVRENCARLVHLTRPRDLDPALGPVAED